MYDESDEPRLDEPIPEADRVWLLDQELGPEIRRVFRRVMDDRTGAASMSAVTQVFYDTAFGPFADDRDFLGFFYNEILHQDTCHPHTADDVEVVAWLAVDDRVPAPQRMDLVELLFAIATVGERQAADCWPDKHPDADPVSEDTARVAVEAAAGPVFARWDAECTAVRLAIAQLAAVFPTVLDPDGLQRVRELADRLRGTAAADLLDFVVVMIEGDDAAVLAAVERHTGWDANNDFRGSVRDLPARVRALHLLDQMAFYERRRLRALLPPETWQ